tara:strand:- start:2137 stop:3624 length:1488 start_codon:yes stop_codon:yes gene_type:complete
VNQISIVFPNQLFKESPIFNYDCDILMIEDSLFWGNDKFVKCTNHINKLILLRASMSFYKNFLKDKGFNVIYAENIDSFSTGDYLNKYLENNCEIINVIEPYDYLIKKRLKKFIETKNLKINFLTSPLFISNQKIVGNFLNNSKKPLMGRFYENQRKDLKILIENDGSPFGGKWSFDELNRKKIPKNINIPLVNKCTRNNFVDSAEISIKKENHKTLGSSKFFFYPTNFEEAESWLNDFLQSKFYLFGDYEDAINKKNSFLWHSILSPLLNVGLITPKEVIEKALIYGEQNQIPLNSVEGFIRQIIGWREFISLVYRKYGVKMRTTNFWQFENKPMPKSFYDGSTGIEPVDNIIKNILNFGYCHHIERLMVLGNFMLLCRIHPDQVYKWFMEMFIDSYDWVMVPNVYGMSQFSDGGIFSTKPYISSSNYVRKMSDYKTDDWCETWDGLFWKFISDKKEFFSKQYRLSMLTRNLDKMDPTKLSKHINNANDFLSKI